MPVFEFCCKKCGHKFEDLIFKNADIESICCPKCGGKEIEKLFSVFGLGRTGGSGEITTSASSCSGCQRTTCAGCK